MTANLAAARLKARESVIEAGQQTFVEVGRALADIRDERLFREAGFVTFDDYCRSRWGMGKSYASQIISAGRLGEEFRTLNNEAQAHALRNVPKRKRAEVLAAAQQAADETGHPITAATITEAYESGREDEPVTTELAIVEGGCPICGTPLDRAAAKYCSNACAAKGRTKERPMCEWCGEKAVSNTQKRFCSLQCSGKANRSDYDSRAESIIANATNTLDGLVEGIKLVQPGLVPASIWEEFRYAVTNFSAVVNRLKKEVVS